MENQSDIEQIIESIRAFTQSPEYAQLQELAIHYKTALVAMDKAFKPHAEVIQQAVVELYKALAPIVAALQALHLEVDIQPMEEMPEVPEVQDDAEIDLDSLRQNVESLLGRLSWVALFLDENTAKDLAFIALTLLVLCDIAIYISNKNSNDN